MCYSCTTERSRLSRGCLLLRGTWSRLRICRRSVLPYTRSCNCLWIMITFYTLLTLLFCIATESPQITCWGFGYINNRCNIYVYLFTYYFLSNKSLSKNAVPFKRASNPWLLINKQPSDNGYSNQATLKRPRRFEPEVTVLSNTQSNPCCL